MGDVLDLSYRDGLEGDGLARFVDSAGEAWLIPIEDRHLGAGEGRRMVRLYDLCVLRGDPRSSKYIEDRALGEYLASLPPKLPTEVGALIRVTEVTVDAPDAALGLVMRMDDSGLPWATFSASTRTYWLRDDQIATWNRVDIVDREG